MTRLAFAPLAAVCCLTTVVFARQDHEATPGQFVRVGDHRLFVRCTGTAGARPTVILESGGGGSSADWSAVQRVVSGNIRTCAYDRAGAGQSDKGPGPRTLAQETFELHAMLAAAEIDGRYVLVGQSIGGLLVRLYAEQFGPEVAGVVLVDPTHESSVLGSLRYGGMVRLREKAVGNAVPTPRLIGPIDVPEPSDADYLAEELAQIHRSRRDNPQPLADKPLVVLAAGKRPAAPPGIAADVWSSLRDERDEQVRDLTGLSSNSAYEQDATSGHGIQADNPELVARAIQAVVEAAAMGGRLKF